MEQNITSNRCLATDSILRIDEACFNIYNYQNVPVSLFYTLDECYMCDELKLVDIEAQGSSTFPVNTKYPINIHATNLPASCNTTFKFGEHGKYGWNITSTGCSDIYILQKPSNIYIPILVAVLVYILIAVVWSFSGVMTRAVRNYLSSSEPVNVPEDVSRIQESSSPTSSQSIIRTTKVSTRIQSIDTFRGISILLMIFVNNGGGNYKIFNHTAWNGITIADLVLPWFAWIMGLTITISKRADLRVSNSRGKVMMRCLQRSFNLIFLGLILNSKPYGSLTHLRFPGVLQLLAVGYFFCATLETVFIKSFIQFERTIFRDILNNWAQWILILGVVILHTGLTFFLPVPGCPQGYLGPGGYHHHRHFENCTAGAAGYIDRLIFGNHVYHKTNNPIYGTILPHDPEGLLNSISSIFIVYLGVHGGKILLSYYHCKPRVIRWIAWSAFTGLIAGILCNFKKEGGLIPLNKNMMTLSFVLLTSSSAFFIFSLLYLIIDYKRLWSGKPFIFAGINPIFLYVGHYITTGMFPWSWDASPSTSHQIPLVMDLWTTTLWGLIAYRLYKKDIIFTV